MEDNILKKSIRIKAPVSAVWKALTDPGLIKQYFFGTNVRTDWKAGSPIIFTGEWEGKQYEDKGTILEVVAQKLLKFNYWSNFSGTEDIPENYANIIYELMPEDSETVLTVSQDGHKSKEAREHSDKNWGAVLNAMKEMLEK